MKRGSDRACVARSPGFHHDSQISVGPSAARRQPAPLSHRFASARANTHVHTHAPLIRGMRESRGIRESRSYAACTEAFRRARVLRGYMRSAAGGPTPAEGDENATDSQHSELPLPPMEEDFCCPLGKRGFQRTGLPNLTECPLARDSDRAGRSTQAADAHLALLSGLRPAH